MGMSEYDTETLLGDLNVLELLDGKVPKDHNPDVPPYQAAEAFLVLFTEREEYELCDMLYSLSSGTPDLQRAASSHRPHPDCLFRGLD